MFSFRTYKIFLTVAFIGWAAVGFGLVWRNLYASAQELDKPAAVEKPAVAASLVAPTPAVPPLVLHPAFRAQVIRVHDGDTALLRLQLEAGVSVEVWIRLEGFNAPELRGPNKELAAKATQALSGLLLDYPVWARLTGDQTFARYVGRVYVVTPDGPVDVSVRLTQLGFAVTQGD